MSGINCRKVFHNLTVLFLSCTLLVSYAWAVSSPVPQTGQSISIAVADDGAMKMGYLLPAQRFTDNSNGTITDNLTGLIWLKNGNCFGNKSWSEAFDAISTLTTGVCGLSGTALNGTWSIPNLNELKSLTIPAQSNSASWLNSSAFLSIDSGKYWSSTTAAVSTDSAWSINFADGSLTYMLKLSVAAVLPVFREKTLHVTNECITCHESDTTPGSGNSIVSEWQVSTHSTKSGASCVNCHDDGNQHPAGNVCDSCHSQNSQVKNPTNNPDRDDKCAKCHAKINPRSSAFDGFKPLTYSVSSIPLGSTTLYTHFSTGRHANYVTTNYKQNCRKCHNPHDTTFGKDQRTQWARSGHGSTTTPSKISTDFKSRGSALPANYNYGPYCVRCHTSTGYINFVTSNFAVVQALPDFDGTRNNYPILSRPLYQDKSREGINCNVCHSDGRLNDESSYSGRLRNIPPPQIWYTYSSHPLGVTNTVRATVNVQFETLGASNLCVVCHSGREVGDIIKVADRQGLFDYTGTSLATRPAGIVPHDSTAGLNLLGNSGFNFYTSTAKYSSSPAHKTASTSIGGTSGACIGCHMKNNQPHLFRSVAWQNDNISESITSIASNSVCLTCHTGSDGNKLQDSANLNSQRDNFRAAVVALGTMIPANRNWKVFGNAVVPGSGPGPGFYGGDSIHSGAYTMGANFIYNLFFNEPGAYVHNPIYTKQLIYDAIDWLADGSMDYENASSQVYDKINAIAVDLTWDKGSPAVKYGQNGVAGGAPFTKTHVLKFICKDYDIVNPTVCNRW